MGSHTDMHLANLSWEVEAEADPNAPVSGGGRNARDRPVPIPEIAAVTAKLSGEIRPYDGDLRHAFEKIDRLAENLQNATGFDRIAVIEYPIDPGTSAALSGEVRRQTNDQVAGFSLSMTLRLSDGAD